MSGTTAQTASAAPDAGRSFWEIARGQFLRNRLAVAGAIVIALLATVAVWAPLLATDKPYRIRAIFDEEYENSYFSALDLLARLERLESAADRGASVSPPAEKDPKTQRREALALLSARMEDLARALPETPARQVRALSKEIRGAVTGADAPGDGVSRWAAWSDRLESVADPDTARIQPVTLYPAFRALGATEIFFVALWFYAVVIVAGGLWRRGWKAAAPAPALALAVAVLWRVFFPPVADARDYRLLIESAANAGSAAAASESSAPDNTKPRYLLAPVPYGENQNLLEDANLPPSWWRPAARASQGAAAPRRYHALGTDPNGRDILARLIYGARISMLIGIVAVSIFVSIGIVVGALAGYFRGWVDLAISRVIEVVICFPTLFLLLILIAYLRPNIYTLMAALGLISWTGVARLERGEFLRLVNQDFVMAVRALGGGSLRIIFRHILPNALGPILVSASFGVAHSILAESTLSFLGFGVPPDQASWGGMLKTGNDRIQELWWMVVFPGIALFTTVTCFNLAGEGLRDATDPRLMQ